MDVSKRKDRKSRYTPALGGPTLLADRALLLATAFVSGASVLVIEIIGSRVLAPYYGSGLYTWSALIAVTLAALALGYWLGGRAVDRWPRFLLLFVLVLAAGLWSLAIPWMAASVLRLTVPLDIRLGVLTAATILFFPCLAALGCVSPFAIRLAAPREGQVGTVSGLLYAVSTLGSLAAALGTGFLLIPNMGARAILSWTGLTLILLAAVGFLAQRRTRRGVGTASVAGVIALGLIYLDGSRPPPQGLAVLTRIPSFYGLVRVVQTSHYRILTVNGIAQNYQPRHARSRPLEYGQFVAALPFVHSAGPLHRPDARPAGVLIGLGAGELAVALERAGIQMDAVEIDPKIAQVARDHFGFDLPRERVHLIDGRVFLERGTSTYDYIVLDAFLGDELPWHLFTVESLRAASRRLRPGGLLVANYTSIVTGDSSDVKALVRTLRYVFPHVKLYTNALGSELSTLLALASEAPIELDPAGLRKLPDAQAAVVRVLLRRELAVGNDGLLLTDDYNPINVHRVHANRLWRKDMVDLFGLDWRFWTDF
jgi:predicted membrane-bound spermidine synthase